MASFLRDGVSFRFRETGSARGVPFLFQHGLGSDLTIPLGLYTPLPGFRLIGMDFRGHGETRPLGDVKRIDIADFADDLIALMDHLGLDRAVVGGLSMGAAVALSLGLRYPERVRGLALVRPAWIDRPHPQNARVFSHIAQHILKYGAEEGRRKFLESVEYQSILNEDSELARSLEQEFTEPRAEECVARLERLPHDSPCQDREELRVITAPTLVIGQQHDPVHPWETSRILADLIANATLREVPARGHDLVGHVAQIQASIDAFLSAL